MKGDDHTNAHRPFCPIDRINLSTINNRIEPILMAITTQDSAASASGTESETRANRNQTNNNNNNNSKKSHKARRKKKKTPADNATTTNGHTDVESKDEQEEVKKWMPLRLLNLLK